MTRSQLTDRLHFLDQTFQAVVADGLDQDVGGLIVFKKTAALATDDLLRHSMCHPILRLIIYSAINLPNFLDNRENSAGFLLAMSYTDFKT